MNARIFEHLCDAVNPFRPITGRACRKLEGCLEEIWSLATFHAVRPPLMRALESASIKLEVIGGARQFARDNQIRAMHVSREIAQVSTTLSSAGIAHLFMKGATLGTQVFGGPEKREFNDIDLLVSPAMRDRAFDILGRHGFEPVISDATMRDAFFDYMGQHALKHTDSGLVVDLHWSIVGDRPFPVSSEKLLGSRARLYLAGTEIPVPAVEDLGLLLAGHGQKEGWASFEWVLDFAAFSAQYPDLDWQAAFKRSEERRCSRPLLTAMMLAKRHFGKELDAAILARAELDREICEDVHRVWARHANQHLRQSSEDSFGSLRLCETPAQKARVYLNLLTTRTIGDYEAFPLPRRYWGLYHLTRPIRLVWQRLQKDPAGLADRVMAP